MVQKAVEMLLNQVRTLQKVPQNQRRCFWSWINMMFNKIDEERRRTFGPDRTCAEWLLRNGAAIKWRGSDEFLNDYNQLPPEGSVRHIEEVDATDSSIMHHGFDHFEGCEHITKVVLHKCGYLENEAMKGLGHLELTLRFLQVSSCANIDETGLIHLLALKRLNTLVLFDLPYVRDKANILDELRRNLSNCNVTFK